MFYYKPFSSVNRCKFYIFYHNESLGRHYPSYDTHSGAVITCSKFYVCTLSSLGVKVNQSTPLCIDKTLPYSTNTLIFMGEIFITL